MIDAQRFIAHRVANISGSGIRRIFDLAATLKDPIDFSMGQPDFPVPEPIKAAAVRAVLGNHNGYTVTFGLPALRERISRQLAAEFGHDPGQADWSVFVTSGVSGGLMLAMLALLDPGEEVIIPDPYFVSYPHLVTLAGGTPVPVDTAPNYVFDPGKIDEAVSPRTKAIMLASPSNPTGVVYSADEVRGVCAAARRHNLLIISDEIYNVLCFDGPATSPARFAPERTIILRGFGKTYGATGWRMGFAAGPSKIIMEMGKLQQYTFVCAPHPLQEACITALDVDMSDMVATYRRKRDLGLGILRRRFEVAAPGGGFYFFCRAPERYRNATAFVEAAIARNVLTVPGSAFSRHDTHFRISYAVADDKLRAGCEILCELAG